MDYHNNCSGCGACGSFANYNLKSEGYDINQNSNNNYTIKSASAYHLSDNNIYRGIY